MEWTLEPGHSAAEFCVRHMMVTWGAWVVPECEGVTSVRPGEAGRGVGGDRD